VTCKSSSKKYAVGVDLGGTKICTAVIDSDGRVITETTIPTNAAEGPERVIGRIKGTIRHVIRQSGVYFDMIAGIGIGSPGPLNWKTGEVLSSPNLPGWDRIPLRKIIQQSFDLPTYLENDANAAAIGEHRYGAGSGVDNMVYITISTGIGGGIICGGRIYRGETGMAGEVGHMIVNPGGPECKCGNKGCLEAFSSGTAIASRMRERLASKQYGEWRKDCLSAKDVFEAAEKGVEAARKVVQEAIYYLGVGVLNLTHLFNPRIIVIGGGVANGSPFVVESIRQFVREKAFRGVAEAVDIVPAGLGALAGVIGAATLPFVREDENR